MDVTAISGMISGLKAAAELAKLAINARDAAIIRTKAIELEREILAAYSSALMAQADQFALLGRVRDLKKNWLSLKHGTLRVRSINLPNCDLELLLTS